MASPDKTPPLTFYLGTHMPNWLAQTDAPLFVSRRRLSDRKTLPRAQGRWALDSGGFTELNLHGEWQTTPEQYIAEVIRYESEVGGLDWVAPQDWMCEPFVLAKTGLSVEEHQTRTILNFEKLRYALGDLVIPVLQGWEPDDYLRHREMYEQFALPLDNEPVVGLGSVCRRQNMAVAGRIVRSLDGINLHAFGAKLTGLRSFGDALTSADSMAWSYAARRDHPLPGCTHKSCANCLRYALRWRNRVVESLDQLTLSELIANHATETLRKELFR